MTFNNRSSSQVGMNPVTRKFDILLVVVSWLTLFVAELKGSVDRLIVDPPFFSEGCQTKCKSRP